MRIRNTGTYYLMLSFARCVSSDVRLPPVPAHPHPACLPSPQHTRHRLSTEEELRTESDSLNITVTPVVPVPVNILNF